MIEMMRYQSPIGEIYIASKENRLIGLWIEGQANFLSTIQEKIQESYETPILLKTKSWLNRYFNKENPDSSELEIALIGSEFQIEVWNILRTIPYGNVRTYGEIAKQIAEERGIKQMSAQAIGSAVGHNPISIIIPCHRVIGSKGKIGGYAGGIDKKVYLLQLENVSGDVVYGKPKKV